MTFKEFIDECRTKGVQDDHIIHIQDWEDSRMTFTISVSEGDVFLYPDYPSFEDSM